MNCNKMQENPGGVRQKTLNNNNVSIMLFCNCTNLWMELQGLANSN